VLQVRFTLSLWTGNGLYDTSSHAFKVQIDISSHEGRGAVAMGVLAAHGADHLTFTDLFISLRIVQDIDLVDWAIIWAFVFVCEYLYGGLKSHADCGNFCIALHARQ